jgi:hypothetical protein
MTGKSGNLTSTVLANSECQSIALSSTNPARILNRFCHLASWTGDVSS